MLKKCIPALLLLFSLNSHAQISGNNLFDDSYLHEVKIYFEEPDFWEIMTQNYFNGLDQGNIEYTSAPLIIIDGDSLSTVGVRQKGFSSHFASNEYKKSLKIDFDKFAIGQTYDGLKKINLNNGVGDPGFLRDVLCYDMMRTTSVAAPRTAHVKLYINNLYWGLYTLVEQVDKTFLADNFSDNDGNLFKNMGWSSLEWMGTNPSSYQEIFDLKTNEIENDWTGIIELHNVINNASNSNFPTAIQQVFDVPGYLKVLAIDILTNNWDSYIEHGRNFYLYQESNGGKFKWIPWDYNLAMGGEFSTFGNPFVLDTICPIISDFSYLIDGELVSFTDESTEGPDSWFWDFGDGSTSIEQNPEYLFPMEDIYTVCLTVEKDYVDSICTKTNCRELNLIFNVGDCPTVISGSCPYPASDPVLLEVMLIDDFCCQNSWDGICQEIYDNIASGGGGPGGGWAVTFPLLLNNPNKVLIDRLLDVDFFRDQYLNTVCEIMENNFTTERLFPIVDATANQIRDAVYEDPNYLFTPNYFEWDVGYGGVPNGAIIPQLKVFIDERIPEIEEDLATAGHDCNTLVSSPIAFMEVVINELVADNDSTSTIIDAAGEFDDWIELYNNTTTEIDLSGFYLSDNTGNPFKWAFPLGTTIEAESYLIVWADEQEGQQGLHAGFRLNKDGEQLQLIHADGTVIDSLDYGLQTTNVGYARVPNGVGPFLQQTSTFNDSNGIPSATSFLAGVPVKVYPNPASDYLYISVKDITSTTKLQIGLYNGLGQLVLPFSEMNDSQEVMRFSVRGLSKGHYSLVLRSREGISAVKIFVE